MPVGTDEHAQHFTGGRVVARLLRSKFPSPLKACQRLVMAALPEIGPGDLDPQVFGDGPCLGDMCARA